MNGGNFRINNSLYFCVCVCVCVCGGHTVCFLLHKWMTSLILSRQFLEYLKLLKFRRFVWNQPIWVTLVLNQLDAQNLNWMNQLSNTTIWWLDICCLLHRYQLHVSAFVAIFRLIDWQQTCKQLYFGMRFVCGGGGLGLDGGTRSCVCWVGRVMWVHGYCCEVHGYYCAVHGYYCAVRGYYCAHHL